MTTEIRQGDLFEQSVEALVHPTNSLCKFTTSLSLALRERAGDAVEKELLEVAPFAVGAAVVTGAGKLTQKWVIHVPVLDHPGQHVHAENVRKATRAALLAALRRGIDSIAMPALLTEKAGVSLEAVVRGISDEIRAHKQVKPQLVVVVDQDPEVIENFSQLQGGK